MKLKKICFPVFFFFVRIYLRSAFVAGGFLVAQFVLIDLEPSHCPFMAVIALSASCKREKNEKE